MFEAVIFDMDGLLINSEEYWFKARQLLAKEVNREWNIEDQLAAMGGSTQEWVSYMAQKWQCGLTEQEIETRIIDHMHALYKEQIPYNPGAVEAVTMCAELGPIALASGSPTSLIKTVTADPALRGKFRAILFGDDFERGKPAPDIYLAAAKALGVNPANCVCLEDSGNGILSGKNAGLKVIAVPDDRFLPPPEKLNRADLILNSLTELSPEMLEELAAR